MEDQKWMHISDQERQRRAIRKLEEEALLEQINQRRVRAMQQGGVGGGKSSNPKCCTSSGLAGTSYVFVNANGTPEQNGNELVAAYNTAKTMNPTADKRISIIAAPGYYFLSSDFELDTDYIDLVSLDGNRSIIIDGFSQPSQIYYFSDSPSNSLGALSYAIDDGGNDMYDTGNKIFPDGNQIAYTHTQLPIHLSGGMPIGASAINTFTYTANGTGLPDNSYFNYGGQTNGNGTDAQFDIVVSGGVVTSVLISDLGTRKGKNYAVNDTITILGGQIGGSDGVDDIVITVTSLSGYFNINTSIISSNDNIDTFTYVSPGSGLSDYNYDNLIGSTNGQGQHAQFDIVVSGGVVTDVTVVGFGIGYNVNDTITILGSQIGGTDGVDDVVITVTAVTNRFGSSASYFTNMYPGFFFMGAQNTSIDQFTIDGGLGADGGGFVNYYNYPQEGYQVYVKRVGGTSDPSVNHIIIVNPSDASQITQIVSSDTNEDYHDLTGLLSGNVTEIYYLLFAKSNGGTLSSTEVTDIVSEFLTIKNSSGTINELLSNLNSNYSNLTQQVVPVLPASTISVIANDVSIKGVDVLEKQFKIGNNLNLLRVENCSGGRFSFNVNDNGQFPNNGIISGTFIDCTAGASSFGINSAILSGVFTNCRSGNYSFAVEGEASGTFTNCVGGITCFAFNGNASGTFIDCVSGSNSFGYNNIATGTFINCVGTDYCFGSLMASGTYTNCTAGINSFAFNGNASGTFTNCIASADSFGAGAFGSASGTFVDCVGANQCFGYNGSAAGTFTNCVSGSDSFGLGTGTLTGKLYYCRLTSGSFQTLTGTGLMRACVDGNDVFIPSLDA